MEEEEEEEKILRKNPEIVFFFVLLGAAIFCVFCSDVSVHMIYFYPRKRCFYGDQGEGGREGGMGGGWGGEGRGDDQRGERKSRDTHKGRRKVLGS